MGTTTESTSAADRAYDHIKRAILSGDRRGGSFLTEGEVAEEIGISRTPVREALLRLQADNLIALYPKKGALVVPVTPREAHEVLEARQVIEEWAANRAWPRRADLLATLPAHLQAMREAQVAGDAFAFAVADSDFHAEIVDAADNEVIARQYRSLRDRQMCILTNQIRVSAARMKHAVTAHRDLIRLLENGTRAEFRKASHEHVIDAMDRLGVRGPRSRR
jgi:DNA-binding GntR family transcriptional regulator